MSDIYIGVTQVTPREQLPTLNPINYKLCRFHEGEFEYVKQIFRCESRVIWGRYVIIQRQTDVNGFLHLCEVEVYEEKPGTARMQHAVNIVMLSDDILVGNL